MRTPFTTTIYTRLLKPYLSPRVLAIGLMAYANAIPALLTASTLSIWLKEFGLSYSSIGLFSLVHLPYNFKFLWAPVLDHVSLPFLTEHLGQRRGWLFFCQFITIVAILIMGLLQPSDHLVSFIVLAVLASFAASSQHVILLAYQVQTMPSREWGVAEGMSVFGFRMGLLTSGAGALYLASFFTWNTVYLLMAGLMFVALLMILIIPEPCTESAPSLSSEHSLTSRLVHWFRNVAWRSYQDFIQRQGWVWVLIFMMLYRLPDHVLGPMPTLFYLDLGFSKVTIATASKVFGLATTVIGGFCGGLLLREWSFHKTLLVAGILHGLSMLCFLVLLNAGCHLPTLYITVGLEHLTSGLGLTALFAYQFSQSNTKYAATQLALMTAAAALGHRLGGVCSGYLVEGLQWSGFFSVVTLSAIPGLLLIRFLPGQDPKVGVASVPQTN